MALLNEAALPAEAATITTRVGGCLIVTAPSELGGNCLEDLEREALSALSTAPTSGLIFELAGVQFMDSHEFQHLQRIAKIAEHLGVRTIFSGIRPGIVVHLVNSDFDAATVPATLGLDEALAIFSATHAP